jgi:hypothetical protein
LGITEALFQVVGEYLQAHALFVLCALTNL